MRQAPEETLFDRLLEWFAIALIVVAVIALVVAKIQIH